MSRTQEVDHIPLTEKQFKASIVELAKVRGWVIYQTWLALHSPGGFPDLALVHESDDGSAARLVFLEVKSEKGKLGPEQEYWLTLLAKVPGVVAACVRPSDWDWIVSILEKG